MDDVSGITTLNISVVVSGQASNVVAVLVAPPTLTALRLYDTASLVGCPRLVHPVAFVSGGRLFRLPLLPRPVLVVYSGWVQPPATQATDSCAQVVGDTSTNVTLEVDGLNLGSNLTFYSMSLTSGGMYVCFALFILIISPPILSCCPSSLP